MSKIWVIASSFCTLPIVKCEKNRRLSSRISISIEYRFFYSSFRCQPDYVGERCEIRAPCARRPCGGNNVRNERNPWIEIVSQDENCIPIPIELSVPGEQSYRCICDVGDELTGTVGWKETIDDWLDSDNKCIYHGEGKCKGDTNPCNHGKWGILIV